MSQVLRPSSKTTVNSCVCTCGAGEQRGAWALIRTKYAAQSIKSAADGRGPQLSLQYFQPRCFCISLPHNASPEMLYLQSPVAGSLRPLIYAALRRILVHQHLCVCKTQGYNGTFPFFAQQGQELWGSPANEDTPRKAPSVALGGGSGVQKGVRLRSLRPP